MPTSADTSPQNRRLIILPLYTRGGIYNTNLFERANWWSGSGGWGGWRGGRGQGVTLKSAYHVDMVEIMERRHEVEWSPDMELEG